MALSDGIGCPDPRTFQPQGRALGSSSQPPGLRGSWLVDRSPAGPLAAPGGARGSSAARSAAAGQRRDPEDGLTDALSICSSGCPAVCSFPAGQYRRWRWFPQESLFSPVGWVAWAASGREGRDLELEGGRGPDEAGTVPTLSTRKVLVPGLLTPVPARTGAPWAQGSSGSSSGGCSGTPAWLWVLIAPHSR